MFLPCHCTPIILVTITLLTGNGCAETGVLRRRLRGEASDDPKPPDFHAKTVDTDLASKLANMRLGAYNRLRRQTESEIKTNAEAAEVDSAVAAIQAEEAKESALNAFKENEKIEQFIQSNNGGTSSKQTSSQSSFSSSNSQGQSPSKNQEKQEEEYEDEDDDDDDDEAEETIVEDETVRVKIDTNDKKVGHKQGNGTSSNATTVGSTAGVGVCQGLLDLKRMTDDFRERLQALVQRQEQAVEKLEGLSNNPSKQLGTSSSNSDTEPSRACVFIEEHIKSVENSQAQKSQQSKGQSEREKGNSSGKIHIYTSEGVLPNAPETESSERRGSQRAEGFQRYKSSGSDNGFQRQDRMEETGRQTQSGSGRGPLPIFEGRIMPSHNAQQSRNSRDASQLAQNNRLKVARSPDSVQDSEKEKDHEQDIELEKIIWLKPGTTSVDGEEKVEQGDYDKYKNAVSEIMDQGYDVLIIPISRKFTKAKDVAYSLLDVMRGKKAEKSKTRRFRMTIKRF